MRIAALLFILSFSASGQFRKPDYNYETARGEYETINTEINGHVFPKLKKPVQAYMKSGAKFFSRHEYMDPKNLPSLPWNKYAAQCEREEGDPPLSGHVMFMTKDYAAVRLIASNGFCGKYFNSENSDKKLIFVKRSDIQKLAPMAAEDVPGFEQEAIAECTGKGCDRNKLSKGSGLKEAMAIMSNVSNAPRNPEKSDEVFDKYMKCWAGDEKNYEQYGRLADLAGKAMRIDFRPASKGGARIQAVIEAGDSDETKGNPSHLNVSAKHLKCIAMIESNWNPLRQNDMKPGAPPDPNKAIGLMQQTNVNVDHIRRMLEGGEYQGKKIPPQKWAVDLWNNFHAKARSMYSPVEYKMLTTNPLYPGQSCAPKMADKMRDAPCPINSMASAAIYQLVLELHARGNLKKYLLSPDKDITNEERYPFRKAVAVGHNTGPGPLGKAMKFGTMPEEWVDEMVKYAGSQAHEVKNYGKRLENCISAKSCEPPWDRPLVDKKGKPTVNKCASICAN